MTDAPERDLALANPVTDDTVRRLAGPHAREELLAGLLADTHPVTTARDDLEQLSRRARAGVLRPTLMPVLAAAGVLAVVVLTAVPLRDGTTSDQGPDTAVAAGPVASACPGVSLPGAPQVVDRGPGGTFCVHVPPQDEMTEEALARTSSGGTAPMAWSALTVPDGPADVLALTVVGPVPAPAADQVLLLVGTSDASPDDVVDADGTPLPTHRLFGTAGAEVTGVELVLPDGSSVTASLTDGVWGTWWPARRGGPDASQVRVRTPGGTTITGIDAVRLPEDPQERSDLPPLFRQDDG